MDTSLRSFRLNARSRAEFLAEVRSAFVTISTGTAILPAPKKALAEATPQSYSIKECSATENVSSCVSTASVKKIDSYSPPWTFECSPEEAFARLKGSIAADSSLSIVIDDEDAKYVKVQAQRTALGQDELEFLVRGSGDNVVTFRSVRTNDTGVSDFGAIRNRLETLRKKAGVFDVMGGGLTADSYDVPMKGNGVFGQLKAFYGLQSGEGFESVFEDDE